jgi:hypothetical protein
MIRAKLSVITLTATIFENYVKCPDKIKVANWVNSSPKSVGVNILKDRIE